jgi:hypothetical protein
MAQNGSKKARRLADDQALLLLASGKSVTKTAAKTGLSRRTLTRRLNDPAFRRRLSKFRAELFERGMGILAAAQAGAASALVRLLKSENESVRLGASRSVFELGAKIRENVEIEERLSALEDRCINRGHP